MSEGLSNYGEETLLNALVGLDVDLILYDDSTDALTDSDGTGAITTEPSSGTTTKTITIQSGDLTLTNDDWEFARSVVFSDVSAASGRVDAVAVAENGTSNILFRGLLDSAITDIGPVDKIDPLDVSLPLD